MPSKEKLAQVLWAFQVLQDQFQLQAALLLGVFNCAITGEKIKKESFLHLLFFSTQFSLTVRKAFQRFAQTHIIQVFCWLLLVSISKNRIQLYAKGQQFESDRDKNYLFFIMLEIS